MAAQTHLFMCLEDNFGVLVHDPATGATASIDAPDVAPVEAALKQTGWKLTHILVTHNHYDHVQGIPELKKHHGCRVIAPAQQAIPDADETVREGDTVKLGNLSAKVMETPGHTAEHIVYWFDRDQLLFAGDTLFSIGCGRMNVGTGEGMWQSLLKLRKLPDDTRLYCGHEYTEANIRFAQTIEPSNPALAARAARVKTLRAEAKPTIPSTMGEEKAANPFLRADNPTVAAAVGLSGAPPGQVFGELRARKNRF
jgi:hydroxyacylglutathione hydrolase